MGGDIGEDRGSNRTGRDRAKTQKRGTYRETDGRQRERDG